MLHRNSFRAGLCGAIILWLTASAGAQFSAALQGTVKDVNGAAIVQATVILTSKETGAKRKFISTEEGYYRFAQLPPGRYEISVERPGFKKAVVGDFAVRAEEAQRLNLTLEPRGPEDTVEIRLAPNDASVGQTISRQEFSGLPQVGRNPYELARTAPGVTGDGARHANGNAVGLPNVTGPGGSNTAIFQVEDQVQISANGQRVSTNHVQIDGVSVHSLSHGGAAVVTPNQESVKEVRVLSNTYAAEDGQSTGARIKVVSQNGTNEFHGSAFFKYNDPALNAFNKYGGPEAPPVRVEQRFRQFGGSFGGPLSKERLFFFSSYEGLRNNASDFANGFVETSDFRQRVINLRPGGMTARFFGMPGIEPRIRGALSDGLDLGSLTGALGDYTSATGGEPDGIPDVQRVQFILPNLTRGDQLNTRIDYNRGNNQFAVSAYFTRRNDLQSDPASQSRPVGDLTFKPLNSLVTLIYNRMISATALNEARFNFTRFAYDQVKSSQDTNFGIPRIKVEDLPIGLIAFGAPGGETTPGIFAQNTFEFRDTLSKALSRHALKFGLEIRKEQDNNNLVGGARPEYAFNGLFNLANDAPKFERINADPRTGATADIQRYFRTSAYAFFVQDDWQARPHLTFNLGLRYEYFTPLKEKEGRFSNLVFGPHGLADSKVVVTQSLFQPDRNNFAPRFGFVWSPARLANKLALRGGVGVGYNRIPQVILANVRGNPPYLVRYSLCCASSSEDRDRLGIFYTLGANRSPLSFPPNPRLKKPIDPITGGPEGMQAEIYGTESKLPNSYVYSFSLETQYQLPHHLVASLGYQGSSSHKLVRTVNLNFLYEPSPAFYAVYFPLPDVNANYHAMIARLTQELSQGVRLEGIYRWSKSIDTASYEFGDETNQTYPKDLRSERGPSDFDVKHNFVLSGMWDLPIFHRRQGWLSKAFSGWQMNGILTTHSGFPWTPKTNRPLNTPGPRPRRPTQYFGGALQDAGNDAFIRPGGNFPGGGERYFDIKTPGPPGIGRNSFRGPRYFSVDLSLVKQTGLPKFLRLREGANLDLRANLFNAFNKLNLEPFRFSSPGTFIENDLFFGRSTRGLAGRVVELQARLSF